MAYLDVSKESIDNRVKRMCIKQMLGFSVTGEAKTSLLGMNGKTEWMQADTHFSGCC